jgi:hypothetical protein
MNGNTDQFREDLRLNLSIVMTACGRFITAVEGGMAGTELEWHEQLLEMEKLIEQSRAKIAAASADLHRCIEEEKFETSIQVIEWKAKRQTDKLHARADRYERCANAAVEIAAAKIDEAGQWVFRALLARKETISIQVQ